MSSTATVKMSAPVKLGPKSRTKFEDEVVETVPAEKAGFFTPSRRFGIVIATALVAVTAAVLTGLLANSYELIAAARTENAIIYRIDRLTGQVSLCWPSGCLPILHLPSHWPESCLGSLTRAPSFQR